MTDVMRPPLAMPPFDYTPRPYEGPSREEVLALRRQYVNPAVFTLYREPLMIVEGKMQYLFDETGRRYLDLFAGIVTVSCGHCHPKVLRRVQEQTATLQHATTIYLHPNLAAAGAEAGLQDAGRPRRHLLREQRQRGERPGRHHGPALHRELRCDRGAERVPRRLAQLAGAHLAPHLEVSPAGPGRRCITRRAPIPALSRLSGTPEEIASQSAADIRDLIRYSTPGKVAAFIAEPIQGVGGVTRGAPNYFREAYAIVREHGGLCIADEVQTGFGRTGEHYWGFQNFGVTPDIVTMAKGIGNGVPLAAVTTRREIAEALTRRIHFNTFGGNPVSMAAGLAVLEVIEEDGLQENARKVGGRLLGGLRRLQERHPLVGDVRGMGLMLGVELVTDRATHAPASAQTLEVLEARPGDGCA